MYTAASPGLAARGGRIANGAKPVVRHPPMLRSAPTTPEDLEILAGPDHLTTRRTVSAFSSPQTGVSEVGLSRMPSHQAVGYCVAVVMAVHAAKTSHLTLASLLDAYGSLLGPFPTYDTLFRCIPNIVVMLDGRYYVARDAKVPEIVLHVERGPGFDHATHASIYRGQPLRVLREMTKTVGARSVTDEARSISRWLSKLIEDHHGEGPLVGALYGDITRKMGGAFFDNHHKNYAKNLQLRSVMEEYNAMHSSRTARAKAVKASFTAAPPGSNWLPFPNFSLSQLGRVTFLYKHLSVDDRAMSYLSEVGPPQLVPAAYEQMLRFKTGVRSKGHPIMCHARNIGWAAAMSMAAAREDQMVALGTKPSRGMYSSNEALTIYFGDKLPEGYSPNLPVGRHEQVTYMDHKQFVDEIVRRAVVENHAAHMYIVKDEVNLLDTALAAMISRGAKARTAVVFAMHDWASLPDSGTLPRKRPGVASTVEAIYNGNDLEVLDDDGSKVLHRAARVSLTPEGLGKRLFALGASVELIASSRVRTVWVCDTFTVGVITVSDHSFKGDVDGITPRRLLLADSSGRASAGGEARSAQAETPARPRADMPQLRPVAEERRTAWPAATSGLNLIAEAVDMAGPAPPTPAPSEASSGSRRRRPGKKERAAARDEPASPDLRTRVGATRAQVLEHIRQVGVDTNASPDASTRHEDGDKTPEIVRGPRAPRMWGHEQRPPTPPRQQRLQHDDRGSQRPGQQQGQQDQPHQQPPRHQGGQPPSPAPGAAQEAGGDSGEQHADDARRHADAQQARDRLRVVIMRGEPGDEQRLERALQPPARAPGHAAGPNEPGGIAAGGLRAGPSTIIETDEGPEQVGGMSTAVYDVMSCGFDHLPLNAGDVCSAGQWGIFASASRAAAEAAAGPRCCTVRIATAGQVIYQVITRMGPDASTHVYLPPNQISLLRTTCRQLKLSENEAVAEHATAMMFRPWVVHHLHSKMTEEGKACTVHMARHTFSADWRFNTGCWSRTANLVRRAWFETKYLVSACRQEPVAREVGHIMSGHVIIPGPCAEPIALQSLPGVPCLRTADISLLGPNARPMYTPLDGDRPLDNPMVPYDPYRVQAYIVDGGMLRVDSMVLCLGHKHVTNIGPAFAVQDGCQGACDHGARRGFAMRQLRAPQKGLKAEPAAVREFATLLKSEIERRSLIRPAQDVHLNTIREWAAETASKQVEKFFRVEWDVWMDQLAITNAMPVEGFMKTEFQGNVQPGALETEPKDNRFISNDHPARKAGFIGISKTIMGLMTYWFPEMKSKMSPKEQDADLAAWMTRNANSPEGADALEAGEWDYSRMDSSTVNKLKEAVETHGYEPVLQAVMDLIPNLDVEPRLRAFRRALNCRRVRKFTMRSKASGLALFVAMISGTVASGDFDTTLMNTPINLIIVLLAILALAARGITDGPMWQQGCLEISQSHISVAGDDGRIVSATKGYVALFLDEVVHQAARLGYIVEAKMALVSGLNNRVTFCSRIPIIVKDDALGSYIVKSIRMPSRIFARIGWTSKQGVTNEKQRCRLQAAVAMCELADCTHPTEGSMPILGALAEGIMSAPRMRGAHPLFDKDSAFRYMKAVGRNDAPADVIAAANTLGRSASRRRKRPSTRLREAFYEATGITPQEQYDEEQALLRTLVQGRVYYTSHTLENLLRQEWR